MSFELITSGSTEWNRTRFRFIKNITQRPRFNLCFNLNLSIAKTTFKSGPICPKPPVPYRSSVSAGRRSSASRRGRAVCTCSVSPSSRPPPWSAPPPPSPDWPTERSAGWSAGWSAVALVAWPLPDLGEECIGQE